MDAATSLRAQHAARLVIEGEHDPSRGFNLRELWRYKDLLWFMTLRDVTVRYRQTALGPIWALLQPLLSAGVFTIFFGRVAKIPSDGIPYALFGFTGLILWIFFSNTVGRSCGSLVGSAHLLTKVYFPRVLIPISTLLPGLIDFGIAFVGLLVGFAVYGLLPSWQAIFWVPIILILTGAFALGCGLFLGALNVTYRDVNNGISFAMQLMMFATPIVYPISLVDPKYRWLMVLNPIAGLTENLRACLFGRPVNLHYMGLSLAAAILALVIGGRYFFKVEKYFADVV